jgi:Carboxypeptidase regulatory-like domain
MNRIQCWRRASFNWLFLMLLTSVVALGQAVDLALVRVNVTDPSGAVIPAARVTLTDDGTGVSFSCSTDRNGSCSFNTLKPASYTARVVADQFKAEVREHVILHVGQAADLNFTLPVGAETTTITVHGGAPQVNTVNSELGTTVNGNYILNMPLFDRNPSNLIFLAPGVTNVNGGDVNALGGLNFSSNGQRTFSAELRLDGAVASVPEGGEGATNNVTYKPSVEGIQEFKVLNNGYSAEYGSNGGTVISMITKSGTNEFHGTGFYFTRRPWMDANSWFGNQAGEPRAVYKREEYGSSIGGPIVKKKAFFFFDYEHDQFDQPLTLGAIVPTALERQGDFSQSFNPDGTPVEIYDPAGPIVAGNRPQFQATVNGVPTLNVIPANRLDPLGQQLRSQLCDSGARMAVGR